jgi:hypothetical protein
MLFRINVGQHSIFSSSDASQLIPLGRATAELKERPFLDLKADLGCQPCAIPFQMPGEIFVSGPDAGFCWSHHQSRRLTDRSMDARGQPTPL